MTEALAELLQRRFGLESRLDAPLPAADALSATVSWTRTSGRPTTSRSGD